MQKLKSYKLTGIVWGNYWGGGSGGYASKVLHNSSKSKLIKEATVMLKNGSLDSGMGYESLYGATLDLETTTTIDIKGKEYKHIESEELFIGTVTEEEIDAFFYAGF